MAKEQSSKNRVPNPDGPGVTQERSEPRADTDAVEAALGAVTAAAAASEHRLKELAGRVPGGDSNNYAAVLCDFMASQYGWGLDVIAGLDDRQMIAFVEQALRRHPPPAARDTAPGAGNPASGISNFPLRKVHRHVLDAVKAKARPARVIAKIASLHLDTIKHACADLVKADILANDKQDGYRLAPGLRWTGTRLVSIHCQQSDGAILSGPST
jgi:hypothetical protein